MVTSESILATVALIIFLGSMVLMWRSGVKGDK